MLEMALNLQEAKDLYALEDIAKDRILFYGLAKMTEVIGEAAYKLTHEFTASHPELPWREIIGMRHAGAWIFYNQYGGFMECNSK